MLGPVPPLPPCLATNLPDTRLVKPALLGLSFTPAPEKLSCDMLQF